MGHAEQAGAEAVGYPDVALAVDVQTAVVEANLEAIDFGWIGCREADDMVGAVRDPDPVLLVDGEVERRRERFARLGAVAFADNAALGPVALGEVQQLALRDAERPDIAVGRDDDALHQPEPAAEGDALGRRQRLAVLVEYRDGFAAIAGKPDIVLRVDRRAEGTALHAAAGKAGRDRRQRLAVRVELGGVALPQRVLRLPADGEVVADPEVALAVEHRLAAGAIPAAVELQRQHPGAGREVEVRHERHRPHRLALRDGIERFEQREDAFGLIPRIAGDRLRRRERVRGYGPGRTLGRSEEAAARIRRHPRDAACERIGQRREVRHRRRLAAVERVLNHDAPTAGLQDRRSSARCRRRS